MNAYLRDQSQADLVKPTYVQEYIDIPSTRFPFSVKSLQEIKSFPGHL
jgi:hypothetical protein